jgi:uncharacterized membrane protein YdjX (TVP38/TMEM64 family)
VIGGLLGLAGGLLAAFTTHALIRTAFGNWLDARARDTRTTVRNYVESGNFLLLVIPRLIPVIPFFAINVGLTAAGVSKRSYMLSTLLGLAPMAFIFSSIGSQLDEASALSGMQARRVLLSPEMFVPLGLLLALTVGGWLWVRRQRQV